MATAGVFLLALLLESTLSDLTFEAAFQGHCGENSPCHQLCFDLHDGTFECACTEGYTLSDNGYSCLENASNPGASSQNQTLFPLHRPKGRRIVILPLNRLESRNRIEMDDKEKSSPQKMGRYLRQEDEQPDDSEDEDNPDEEDNLLPEDLYPPMNTLTFTTAPNHPAFHSCTNLECESGGVCIIDSHFGLAGCRCPLGRKGFFCEYPTEVRYPRFKGTSYLTLPILRDAHKSLQITLEFRPEAHDGILLYSGEKLDLQGDFISVTLNRGFVEFRFDCGMGAGLVRSDQPVVLHSWNYLTVYRDRWDAWMQLNSGKQMQGRSKGLFSRITFRLSLFMGGSPNATIIVDRVQMESGFRGCVRLLQINKRLYDFRSGNRGDAIDGLDIEECNADICSSRKCLNGGQCVASSPDLGVCLCPLGFAGPLCERVINIIMPSFNGSSYLQYAGLGNKMLSFIEIQMVFKPYKPNGLLLYNGYSMDGSGDFISINLVNGFVELRFDLGTGAALIRSKEPVQMGEWHEVFVSRTGRDGILEVDNQPKVEAMAKGAFTQLSLPLNLYLGGLPDLHDAARQAAVRSAFTGCIQKVVINNKPVKLVLDALSGVNVDNCDHSCVEQPCLNSGSCEARKDFYICHCLLGYAGGNCEREVSEMIAQPMFNGYSYLKFVDDSIMKRIKGDKTDIRLKFRSFASEGLILWAGEKAVSASSDYLALAIKGRHLHLQYNLGSGEVLVPLNATRVDDGRWHSVHIIRLEQESTLILDDNPVGNGISPGFLNQLNVNSGLYIGGMQDLVHETMGKFHAGLVGCIANLTLATDFHVRLVTQASTGVNIQSCQL